VRLKDEVDVRAKTTAPLRPKDLFGELSDNFALPRGTERTRRTKREPRSRLKKTMATKPPAEKRRPNAIEAGGYELADYADRSTAPSANPPANASLQP